MALSNGTVTTDDLETMRSARLRANLLILMFTQVRLNAEMLENYMHFSMGTYNLTPLMQPTIYSSSTTSHLYFLLFPPPPTPSPSPS